MKTISLFSGAGGLDLGFYNEKYQIVDAVEMDEFAVQTYNYNFKTKFKPRNINDDFKLIINQNQNKNIKLLIGGFPCQGFSMAGLRNPKDPRNQLYKKVGDTLKKLKIPFFILENVRGIESLVLENETYLSKIKKYFNNLGYHINYVRLNASKFGVAQIRKRIIFIGCKKSNKNWILAVNKTLFELQNYKEKIVTVRDKIQHLENKKSNKESNHIIMQHKDYTKKRILKLKIGDSLYTSYSESWKRIDYDKPAPTVKENHGAVHIHPIKNRCLTPRELAALQSFPDTFIFKGSKNKQLVQIGNAVPVKLAQKIAELFKKNIKG